MPSSYSSRLRLTRPTTGELSGAWGDTVNAGVTDLADEAIAGLGVVTMTDANYTLTTVNGATDEARQMFLSITGTLTAARNVVCPAVSKLYFITNSTIGGFAITFKTASGTGISIPSATSRILMCDGTNVLVPFTIDLTNPTITEQVLTDAATTTWDMNAGHEARWTIGATGRTLAAPTNYKVGGQYQLTIGLTTPATMTPTWPAIFKFPYDTAPDLTTSSYTVLTLVWSVAHTKFLVSYAPGF